MLPEHNTIKNKKKRGGEPVDKEKGKEWRPGRQRGDCHTHTLLSLPPDVLVDMI